MSDEYLIKLPAGGGQLLMDTLRSSAMASTASEDCLMLRDPAMESGWHYSMRTFKQSEHCLFMELAMPSYPLFLLLETVLLASEHAIVEYDDDEPITLARVFRV
ncbi:hypothetical protein [Chromobacterium sp.]|uniref:hypothetical protein n=1 Tax=Chromobacterium sp. TaxID=306190 RepID=UPI0035B4CE58